MTTSTPQTASSTFTTDPSLPGLHFTHVLRSELMKIAGMRSTLLLVASTVMVAGLMAAISVATLVQVMDQAEGAYAGMADAELSVELFGQALTTGLVFPVILLGCLGVLAATSEYGTGSIVSSLVAVPRRMTFLAAKSAAVALFTTVVAIGLIVGIGAIAVAVATGEQLPVEFNDSRLWWVAVSNLFVLVAVALVGLGLGFIIRSSAGGIVVLTVLLFVGPVALGVISNFAAENPVVEFFTVWQFGNLIDSVRAFGPTAETMTIGGYEGPTPVGAAVAIAGWLLAVLGTGAALLKNRDA